jgi:hypothetical protein
LLKNTTSEKIMSDCNTEALDLDKWVNWHNDWPVFTLSNSWIEAHLAPSLGGRTIQLALGQYAYLFNSQSLQKMFLDAEVKSESIWSNYGGEKIWPAPQGWGEAHLWPGPPDPVLDGGEYEPVKAFIKNGVIKKLTLLSKEDIYTGLQIEKTVSVSDVRASIEIEVKFHNTSNRPINWSIWPVIQLNAGIDNKDECKISCPLSDKSEFSGGYKVMHGLVNNPQYETDKFYNLVVTHQYIVGKVGTDSRSGWVAYCNSKTGNVMAVTFPYFEGEVYPENTSVQVWNQGAGQIYSRGAIQNLEADPEQNPSYIELEILSPLYKILPGRFESFKYQISCCLIAPQYYVVHTLKNGVVANPLEIRIVDNQVHFSGKYGVFAEGFLILELKCKSGERVIHRFQPQKVNPLSAVEYEASLPMEKIAEETEIEITLDLYKENYRIETFEHLKYVI